MRFDSLIYRVSPALLKAHRRVLNIELASVIDDLLCYNNASVAQRLTRIRDRFDDLYTVDREDLRVYDDCYNKIVASYAKRNKDEMVSKALVLCNLVCSYYNKIYDDPAFKLPKRQARY